MSTDYRNSSQRKHNAVQRLDVEMLARLNAASEVCDRLLKVASKQIQTMQEHVAAGGDFLESLMGSEDYDKMRAAPEAEVKQEVAPPIASPASPAAEKPQDAKPRRYLPRIKAPTIYVLYVRVAELQRELVPLVQGLGDALIAAGVDVMRILSPDAAAKAVHDEFGIELEDIDEATYDLMVDTITKTNQWLREFKQQHAQEIAAMNAPPNKEGAATDGK